MRKSVAYILGVLAGQLTMFTGATVVFHDYALTAPLAVATVGVIAVCSAMIAQAGEPSEA